MHFFVGHVKINVKCNFRQCSCFKQIGMYALKQRTKKEAITLALLLISLPGIGQVYNYVPLSAFNLETNPAILANAKFNNRIMALHQNSFSTTDPFNYSSLRFSKYLKSKFVGFGVSLNRTSHGQRTVYYHAALGCGYRNVLFNKLFIRLGILYKINQINASPGIFDYFTYTVKEAESKTAFKHNLNWSVMLGNSQDTRYVSFSKLNMNLTRISAQSDFSFPEYYSWTVGNLLSFGRKRERKLSYSGFAKKIGSTTTVSHYMNLHLNARLGRKYGLLFGGRIGMTDEQYYHIAPMVKLYNYKCSFQIFYNLHFLKDTYELALPQSTQISFIYKY